MCKSWPPSRSKWAHGQVKYSQSCCLAIDRCKHWSTKAYTATVAADSGSGAISSRTQDLMIVTEAIKLDKFASICHMLELPGAKFVVFYIYRVV